MRLGRYLRVLEALLPRDRAIRTVSEEMGQSYQWVRTVVVELEEQGMVEPDGSVILKGQRPSRIWRLTYRGRRVLKAWHA